MKSQILSTLFLATLASAKPVKVTAGNQTRAAGGPIGYGAATTGGAGGAAVTVTSCAELEAAVTGTEPKIVTISGMISGCGIIGM